jgi:transposase
MVSVAVYLAVGAVDLRGAFDRLAAVTRQVLCRDPGSGALFIFANRRRNRIKALWWDRNGYTLLYKRLSKGTFKLPSAQGDDACIEITSAEFARIIAGLPLPAAPPPPRILH